MGCPSMICPKSASSIQKQLTLPVRFFSQPSFYPNSETLKTNNDEFVSSIEDINKLIKDFSEQSSKLAEQVKTRKLNAIAVRTRLQAAQRQTDIEKVTLSFRNQIMIWRLELVAGENRRIQASIRKTQSRTRCPSKNWAKSKCFTSAIQQLIFLQTLSPFWLFFRSCIVFTIYFYFPFPLLLSHLEWAQ